ncbi:MAG: hypothetical protein IT535_15705 [Bauldia sp.]|nr:hypothetical protein [Bauldia sp.]
MAEEGSKDTLRDTDIAVIDALKTLVEAMIASGTVSADHIQRMFSRQRDGYIAKEMPDAAVVMEVLRTFADATRRTAPSDAIRRALDEPPQGRA